jgi:hypothetical protein
MAPTLSFAPPRRDKTAAPPLADRATPLFS